LVREHSKPFDQYDFLNRGFEAAVINKHYDKKEDLKSGPYASNFHRMYDKLVMKQIKFTVTVPSKI